jgi:hypothetical protein
MLFIRFRASPISSRAAHELKSVLRATGLIRRGEYAADQAHKHQQRRRDAELVSAYKLARPISPAILLRRYRQAFHMPPYVFGKLGHRRVPPLRLLRMAVRTMLSRSPASRRFAAATLGFSGSVSQITFSISAGDSLEKR